MKCVEEKVKEIDALIQTIVNCAYQCGHNDAPSFVVPDANSVYGYKQLMEALTAHAKEVAEPLIKTLEVIASGDCIDCHADKRAEQALATYKSQTHPKEMI